MKLIFATNNRYKLNEVREILGPSFNIVGLNDLKFNQELKEDFLTLEQNAMQKARFIHDHFGMDCFADDSGLEIISLGGKPGIYSARYAGEDKNALDNMEKVLEEMHGVDKREALFRTVIALILLGKEYLFEGVIEGVITIERKGDKGFGYDPIFQPKGFLKTFAEMNAEEKNLVSHRALAVNKLSFFLKTSSPEIH